MPDHVDKHAVTQLLCDLQGGRSGAADELLPLVYQELRRIAAAYMRRERPNHTLQATALVHEAFLQLVDQTRVDWKNRAHFFGVAAQLMRRILVEHARSRGAQKRGGAVAKLSLEEAINYFPQKDLTLLALDDCLKELEKLDPRQSRIVELRFFGGLTTEETSEVMGLSTATIEREWRSAKAWLHSQLSDLKGRSTPSSPAS
ncbi:MAG: sigma-70 family RNA polymerase sigma factor [Bryobacteraceae bacterium]|nr:sigma-70 family RNA polymerase sigma factor [Bryobacteraceae bacterium]MDW8378888.1 sigma-70 family RNA polymerase sigma factor [Bryobacterales bacterium]